MFYTLIELSIGIRAGALAMIVINYGLECVTNLVITYISYSAHILFDYKLVLANFNLEV